MWANVEYNKSGKYLLRLSIYVLCSFWGGEVCADEFYTQFIHGSVSELPSVLKNTADDDGIPPGRYDVQVSLNGDARNKSMVTIVDKDIRNYCVPESVLLDNDISISKDYFSAAWDDAGKCYFLSKVPYAGVSFDFAHQTMNLRIPQLGMDTTKTVSSRFWDYGNSGFNLHYFLNTLKSKGQSDDYYGSLGGDVSMGRWLLSAYAYGNQDDHFTVPRWMMSTPVGVVQGDFRFGKLQVSSPTLSGFAFNGAELKSDDDMKSSAMRTYAPVLFGVARTNARVEVRQNGYVLYSKVLPPGPFRIDDVAPLNNGELTLTVKEQDGSENSTVYPVTTMANMLHPGDHNYDLAVGVRDDSNNYDQNKLSGPFTYLTWDQGYSIATLNSALLVHKDYQNVGLGTALSLGYWGAVSMGVSASNALYRDDGHRQGGNFSLRYAKSLSERTDLQIIGYQYTTSSYVDFVDFQPDETPWRRRRDRYEAQVYHRFEDNVGLSATLWSQSYWDSSMEEGINIGLNVPYHGASFAVNTRYNMMTMDTSWEQSHHRYYNDQLSIAASVFIPFDLFDKHTYFNSNAQWDDNSRKLSTSYGIGAQVNDRLSYNAGISTSGRNQVSEYVSGNYGFDATNLNLSYSNDNHGYYSGSAQLSGSVVMIGNSLPVFTRDIADSFALVKVKGLEGVVINGSSKTDAAGNALVPLSPYHRNMVYVDVASLPDDVDIEDTAFSLVPTRGSKHYHEFIYEKHNQFLLDIYQDAALKHHVAGNTVATDEHGEELGVVDPSGLLYLHTRDSVRQIHLASANRACDINLNTVATGDTVHKVVCK